MRARAGHACRTNLEASVCEAMGRQGLPHEHRSLHFRVQEEDGTTEYAPAIVARRGPILFLVEPIPAARSGRAIERLTRFLEQHSPEIVLVIVTADAAIDRITRDAYDEIYGASDIETLTARIREQDPDGIVRPFEKPGHGRDTAK